MNMGFFALRPHGGRLQGPEKNFSACISGAETPSGPACPPVAGGGPSA